MSQRFRRSALVATLLIIALATLVPMGDGGPQFVQRFEWSDLFVNLCLFLPLGVLLAAEGSTPAKLALFALLLSTAVELLQGTLIPGRRGSVADVASNVAGALAGLGAYRAALRLRQTQSRAGLALAAGIAALPAILWLASGALLVPAPRGTPAWWGQWAHHFRDTEPFRGSILSVSFVGHPVPDARLESTAALLAEARKGTLTLEVTLLSGGVTSGLTHLASVADGAGSAVIGLEQRGDDLLLRWWSRAAALGLRRPQVSFPGALRAAPGERLTITASVTASSAGATVQRGPERRADQRRLSALTGWRSLIPTRDLTPRAQSLFDVVWTLGFAGYVLFAVRVLRYSRLSY